MLPQHQQGPPSPSWSKLETRSTSFPHTRTNHVVASFSARPVEDGEVRTWASEFQNRLSQNKASNSISPSSSPTTGRLRQKPLTRRTPVLTLALLKLHENMDKFCLLLHDPTYDNVRAACEILDSTAATASSSNFPHVSPRLTPGGTTTTSDSQKSSPSLSPIIASWFKGSYQADSDPSASSSAVALEVEWDKICNPLILFAGLEGIYAALSHAESDLEQSLSRLYEKTVGDIQLVREVLCDPFLCSEFDQTLSCQSTSSTASSSILSSHKETARSVATSLEVIMNICICRCKLIEKQREMWSSPDSINVTDAAIAFQSMLTLTSEPDNSAHAAPILKNLSREVESWYHLMEMASSIEKYRFMAAIVNAQKVKLRLITSTSETCIHTWMVKLWQSLLSILPIVFDLVDSATDSLYGFQKSSFEVPSAGRIGPSEDLDAKIGEFLRLEEKSGPPLAIAVVVNSSRSRNRNTTTSALERGFSGRDEASLKTYNVSVTIEAKNSVSSLSAVYMRGTYQLSSPRLLGMRRNSAMKDKTGADECEETDSKKNIQRSELASWPYQSWPSIISLLRKGIETTRQFPGEQLHWSQVDAETLFHASPINSNMWLVVMIKSVEESRWHRRRASTLLGEEVQNFLNGILTSLQFTEIFKRAHVLEIRRRKVESGAESGSSFCTESGRKLLSGMSDGGRSDFVKVLQSFKEELGLRSPRSRETLTSSCGIRLRSGRIRKSTGNPSRMTVSSSSHQAFFLGHQLMNAL